MTREELVQLLKDNVTLAVQHMPQYHNDQQGPLYLVLKFGDEVIDSIDAYHLSRVGEEEIWP